jgi:DUF971 family protein
MDSRVRQAARVAIDPEAGELVVTWKDGQVTRRSLAFLRRHCPCATCRARRAESEAPPVDGELPVLSDEAVQATAVAAGFEPVGRYGIKIRWADGHDYGIYTFEFLRSGEPD